MADTTKFFRNKDYTLATLNDMLTGLITSDKPIEHGNFITYDADNHRIKNSKFWSGSLLKEYTSQESANQETLARIEDYISDANTRLDTLSIVKVVSMVNQPDMDGWLCYHTDGVRTEIIEGKEITQTVSTINPSEDKVCSEKAIATGLYVNINEIALNGVISRDYLLNNYQYSLKPNGGSDVITGISVTTWNLDATPPTVNTPATLVLAEASNAIS